jgi:uncharacterized protein (TIGR02246 family)
LTVEASDDVRSAVVAVLDEWERAEATGDAAAQRALFAGDADVMLVGSSGWERFRGPDELNTFFEKADGVPSWSTWRERHVSQAGDVAWVFANGEFTYEYEGTRTTVPYRMTVILERRGDRWMIVHYHGSEPSAWEP